MAALLSSGDGSCFVSTSQGRSQSPRKFVGASSTYHPSSSKISDSYAPPSKAYTDSDHSSLPFSPPTIQTEFTDLSFASTPASNLSTSNYDEALGIDDSSEDHFSLPLLSQDKFSLPLEIHSNDNLEPPPTLRLGDSYTVSPPEADNSAVVSGPELPEFAEHAEDDSAITTNPSRQVDYFSHDWGEEDIWSSWRYIISKRDEFSNSRRLENALWRTWMKAKNNLKTTLPEELDWLKDCDATWLYGPLQSGSGCHRSTQIEPSSVTLSNSDPLVKLNKKPILKKRSMSETMLRRSLTSSSLLKQAGAAVQAQETRVRSLSHGNNRPVAQSKDSSGVSSPYPKRKHIHFNEQVKQCIAIEVKGGDDDDIDMDQYDEDRDSDDGIMIKRVRSKKRGPSTRRRAKKAAPAEDKTIAMLPSTTLNYHEDTSEPPRTAMKHSTGVYHSPLLSPPLSLEPLRPTKQSSILYFGEEDDGGMDDETVGSGSGWHSPLGSGLHQSTSSGSLSDEPAGIRRTPSGMFVPCKEDDPSAGDGVLGRVIDTVSIARDIAHVIWNVGWRE